MSEEPKLKRDIGYVVASFIVLNGVIGAGIFALPGKLAEYAGLMGPWLILIIGLLIITIVWTFAALASYFKSSGGPVAYATLAFGPMAGFQAGWFLYFGRTTSLAANISVIFSYAAYFWQGITDGLAMVILFTLIIGGLTIINIVGIKSAIRSVNIFSLLKSIPIVALILLGLPHISADGFLPADFPVIDDFGALILLIIYAFVGFEAALLTAGETKNPTQTLPRALISTVVAITVVYFLIQLVYVNAVSGGNSDAPLIELGRVMFGEVGASIIILTAIFSILGSATGILLTAPRMTFAMAENGSLPIWFGKIHEKYQTPANSILFLGILGLLLGVTGTFVYLAMASALARIMAYIICILSLPIVIKKADPDTLKNATKLPGGLIIPGVALLVCVIIAILSPLQSWLYLSGFVIFGSGLYFINSLYNKRAAK